MTADLKHQRFTGRRAYAAGAASLCALLLAAGLAGSQEAVTQPATTAPAASQPTTAPAASQPASRPATTTFPATAPATALVPTSRPAVNGPLRLDFRDASLQAVLEYLSEAAGLVIVQEAQVTGRVTVMSRQPVTEAEAVSLLDTVLRKSGFAAIHNGRVLKIVTLANAKKDLVPVRSGSDPSKIQPSDRIITQIIPIRYADAVKLKADLASLIPTTADVTSNASSNTLIITSTEAIVRRIVEIIQAIDVHMSEVSQVKVFQLKYANATSAARLISEIFREDQTTQQRAGGRFGRRSFVFPGMPAPPGSGGGSEDGRSPPKVTASADDRTNTLVVSAPPDVLKVIEGVVKDLDANPAEEQAVFVYRLRNAQAVNLEAVLNSIFGTSGTSGTSARRQTTGGFGGTSTFGTGSSFGGSSRTGGGSSRFGGGGSSGRGLSSGTMGSSRTSTSGGGRSTSSRFGSVRPSSATAAGASDLAGQVYVVADEDTNSLLVTAASKYFERIKAIIEDLDRAVPQVLIKVLIAEVTHDKSVDLGMELAGFNLRASGSGFTVGTDFSVAAQTGGFAFRLDENNVAAAIRAIANKSALDVLSRPYILTSDNQEASIMVGQEVPFITNTRTTDTGQTINTIEYDDIGIILYVTPHINPNGLVTLDVAPEISTLTGETVPISETVRAPVFAKRSAQSRVAILDGQTIVIGGLMEDRNTSSIDKVPVLGDIPVLGALFRRTVTKKTKTELLIFLTPHVAQRPDDLVPMSKQEEAAAKVIPNAVEDGAFREHMEGMRRGVTTRPAGEMPSTQPAYRRIDLNDARDTKERPKD